MPRTLTSVLPDFTESILFNKPIKEFKESLIYFECKNQEKIALKQGEWAWNGDRIKLTIRKHFTPEEVMQFVIKEQERDNKSKKME